MNQEKTPSNRPAIGFFQVGGKDYPMQQFSEVMFALANGDELPPAIEPTE